ncbi:MAG: HIT domain-containing protein [Acidimicrobiales bacterium]|nr:HIT domain-containing protein [Acidimicrobiales bacterium]
MSLLRLNPLTGQWVTLAVGRAERPTEFAPRQRRVEADPGRPCPFCPGNEEATPPALETYGREGRWVVRVVPNLYPAFHGRDPLAVTNLGPVFVQAPASGIHEVLVLSPDHDGEWADLSDRDAGLVMAALRDRMEDHARVAGVRSTQAVVNHGREAGASLSHPHGQLLGLPFVPGAIADEEAGFRRFEGNCLVCTTIEAELSAGHRVVLDDERATVVCPFWAGSPYELLVMPRTHEVHLQDARPPDLVAVGRALRDALRLLRDRLGDLAYNVVFHTAPHHHDDVFHWHVHVHPRLTSVAGFEQGSGVLVNIVAPELAAQHLREG